jgi:ribosomal protein S4
MAKFYKSAFTLIKRYSRFSNTNIYFFNKRIRYGYKLYQKVFKRYRSNQNFRINVRKPRMAVRRKTSFGQALEIREKFSYLLGGLHSSKLRRYCQLSRSKFFSPSQTFINLIETRLDIILYRSNIFTNPKIAKYFIKSGYVRVNNKKIFNPSFRAPMNSFIDFVLPSHIYPNIFSLFKLSIAKNLIFRPEPTNLSISYKLLRIIVDNRVDIKDIFYPFNFSINHFYRLYSIL